jgi:FkbM family methyltransferase
VGAEDRTDDAPRVDDLVYDVGMHVGEDTAYYLKKGFRVIGFEANPELAARCRERFAQELSEGRVAIVEGAISAADTPTTAFFLHATETVWGTIRDSWAARNAPYGESRRTEVPTIRFAEQLRAWGVPHYLKIDIEGADLLCLEALEGFEHRPAYVSIESDKDSFEAVLGELELLVRLGYERFAAVQQEYLDRVEITTTDRAGRPFTHRFEPGSSGPFGEDVSAPWEDLDAIVARYRRILRRYALLGEGSFVWRTKLIRAPLRRLSKLRGTPLAGWYDTHARHRTAGEPR